MTPVLLDITRLTSPSALTIPTGIDRVVRSYAEYLMTRPRPCHFLGRFGGGSMVLLDSTGLRALLARLDGQHPWSGLDVKGLVQPYRDASLRQLEAELRRLSLWHGPLRHLPNALQSGIGGGFCYLNTGHSNLDHNTVAAIRSIAGRIVIMLHDTIPLDHPEWQTPTSVQRFKETIANISATADAVLANSLHTAERAQCWLERAGRCPPIVTAHLGIDPPNDVAPFAQETPYFVQLGTIEPRKGHALSLAVWEELARQSDTPSPQLFIIGKRGWMNREVFDRLDNSPLMNRSVFEIGSCTDREKTAYLKGAAGLLFPSEAEGFGLPLLEAAQLNVPVLAADLPVFREFSDLDILYMGNRDVHKWVQAIKRLLKRGTNPPPAAHHGSENIPTWQGHFSIVEPFL